MEVIKKFVEEMKLKPGRNRRSGRFRKRFFATMGTVAQVSYATGGYRFAEVIEKRRIPGRAHRGRGSKVEQ
jgi:hypothetical protein